MLLKDFDSKVVDDPKRLSFQLTSSKVNAFLHKNRLLLYLYYLFIWGLIILYCVVLARYDKVKTKSKTHKKFKLKINGDKFSNHILKFSRVYKFLKTLWGTKCTLLLFSPPEQKNKGGLTP